MNKWMMTVALATMIGGTAMAQDATKGDGSIRAEHLTEQMTTRLKLTDEQVPKVKDINERYAAEMNATLTDPRAPKPDGTADREADRAKVKELSNKKNAELKGVLTPEQMAGWQKMQAEMRSKSKERVKMRNAKNKGTGTEGTTAPAE
jgi:Spy/CpxP family protein refolding chaperone